MFQELLYLDLNTPHNRQNYSLKRNQFIPKSTGKPINFNSIHYSSDDIVDKLLYHIITSTSKISANDHQQHILTITFNYNLEAKSLLSLFSKLLNQKPYKKFELLHFQIKNGHISDYHKNKNSLERYFPIIDDMDQFDKDIDISIKSANLETIDNILEKRSMNQTNFNEEVQKVSVKFGKRTNQFFILNINQKIKLVFILLPRSRDCVFSKEEEKQIQELYLLEKNAEKMELHQQNVRFATPIAQLIKCYLSRAKCNFFVSGFPQDGRSIEEVLKLPMRMGQPHEEEIKGILEQYNKDTQVDLEKELDKMRKKVKETQSLLRHEQDNIKALTKTYTKLFARTQPSINILKEKGITDVNRHLKWLETQVKERQVDIKEEEQELKKLHLQIIEEERRHNYYMTKIHEYKNKSDSTKSSMISKCSSKHSGISKIRNSTLLGLSTLNNRKKYDHE